MPSALVRLQRILPTRTRVLAHNAFHRRIGLQGGGVNGHGLPAQEPFFTPGTVEAGVTAPSPPSITRPNLFGQTGSVVKT